MRSVQEAPESGRQGPTKAHDARKMARSPLKRTGPREEPGKPYFLPRAAPAAGRALGAGVRFPDGAAGGRCAWAGACRDVDG